MEERGRLGELEDDVITEKRHREVQFAGWSQVSRELLKAGNAKETVMASGSFLPQRDGFMCCLLFLEYTPSIPTPAPPTFT